MTQRPLAELETRLGYKFVNQSLLQQSLTHASFSGPTASYERLEFLGDRVLGLLLAHYFYELCPDDNEGALSLRLHSEARTETCCGCAQTQLLTFCRRNPACGFADNDNVLADVMESLLAAIYLDLDWLMPPLFKGALATCSTAPASREKDAKSRYKNGHSDRGWVCQFIGNLPNLVRITPKNDV